jgi:hypothetical protein
MDETMIATYCLCDDLLKAIHHQEDSQGQMNDAAVMSTTFTAALFFRGNHASARAMLQQDGDMPPMLSKSRLSRRLHRLQDLLILFTNLLGQIWKTLTTDAIDVIESLPIAVYDNMRMRRAKLYTEEKYRGYTARRKRYVYGLNMHLMVTQDGQPVACVLTHGGFGDVDAFKSYAYELPEGSIIDADKASNDYEIEDLLQAVDHMQLIPMRKKHSQRALPPSVSFVQHDHRNLVETAGSFMAQLLPKSIHTVTSQGFELKVALFVIAYSLNCYLNL